MQISLALSLANPAVLRGPSFEAETESLTARFTTPPTGARKAQINTCIKALKAAGVWSKLDALYLFAAADAQAARQNWIADLYNATAVSSPTFTTDRGYAGDGVASYVDSNFNPSSASSPKFVQNSAFFAAWSRTAAASATTSAGHFDGTKGTTLNPRNTNAIVSRVNQASSFTTGATITDGSGLTSLSRTGASAVRIDKNGVKVADDTNASSTVANGNLKAGTIGNSTFSTTQFAAMAIGSQLSEAEDLALYNALNTYLQAVGAA